MLPELSERLLGTWTDLFPGIPSPVAINYLGLPGSVEGGTATFLGFGDTRSRPDFVVKVHRDPARSTQALDERDNLERLRALGGRVAGSVPRAIFCDAIDGSWLLVQSILDGRPMGVRMTPAGTPEIRSVAADFDAISSWLVDLHRMTLERGIEAQDPVRTRTLEATELCLREFPLSAVERERIQRAETALPSLLAAGVVLAHGDFTRHNVLVADAAARQEIGVIDWTQSEGRSLAGRDLFFFLSTYFLQVRTQHGLDGFLAAFAETFFAATAYSRLVRDCMQRYCASTGIDPSTVRDLFALFLIRQAADDFRTIQICATRSGLPRLPAYLAALRNAGYEEALREQLWIRFFQVFVRKEAAWTL